MRRYKLPKDVQQHIKQYIESHNLDTLAKSMADTCDGCPGNQTWPEPCGDCPLWALRCDLALLRLLRRIEGNNSGESDKA